MRQGTCPHCGVSVRFERIAVEIHGHAYTASDTIRLVTPAGYALEMTCAACPACGRPLVLGGKVWGGNKIEQRIDSLLWPDTAARPVPKQVEDEAPSLAADFREAVSVFPKSKKASAALSRRCLQYILREKAGTKSDNLSKQIEQVLPDLPPHLASTIDAIPQVGNFAAHPIKADSTGQIVDVEEGEAEWLLDVLDALFDHYYVAPAKAAAKRDALNKKLQDLGKSPLKSPPDGAGAPPSRRHHRTT